MTDNISPVNNVKIQQKLTRRVSLQQNKTSLNSALTTEAPSTLLSIKNGSTSNNLQTCVTPSLRPCLSNPTRITSLKSSLKQKNNLPALPKKSVRFSFPLTQIMHFYTPPTVEEDDGHEEGEIICLLDDKECDKNKIEDSLLRLFNSLFSSSECDSNLYHPVIQQHIFDASSNKLAMLIPNWPAVHPTKRFITQMVSLENLSWDNTRSIIKGRVLVHNLTYEKRVTVRMSFNHWQTWIDIDAVYAESSKGDALDRFTFEMITPNHLSYLNRICVNSSCSLAVRYQVNGREFWDNNNGSNFNMQWISQSNHSNESTVLVNSYPSFNWSQRNYLYQIETCSKTTTSYEQEIKTKEMKKKDSHYSSLSGTTNHQFIKTSEIVVTSEQHQYQSSSLTGSTQQQISAHFQLYLERKRRSEERQRAASNGQVTQSPHFLTSSTQNEHVLLSI